MQRTMRALALLVAVTALGWSRAEAAQFGYAYTGNDFTTVSAPYTTSDFVSGRFTVELSSNLNLPITDISDHIQVFSFTDGQQTFTEKTPLTNAIFFIATDGSGDITDWNIGLDVIPVKQINTKSEFGSAIDLASLDNFKRGDVEDNPGSWTQVPPAPIPLPAALPLAVSGLAALFFVGRRRRSRG